MGAATRRGAWRSPPPATAAATAPTATAAVPITTAGEQCGAASPSADPHALARQVAAQGAPSGRRSAATVSAPLPQCHGLRTPHPRPPTAAHPRQRPQLRGRSGRGGAAAAHSKTSAAPAARPPACPPAHPLRRRRGGVGGGVDREKTTARRRSCLHASAPVLFQQPSPPFLPPPPPPALYRLSSPLPPANKEAAPISDTLRPGEAAGTLDMPFSPPPQRRLLCSLPAPGVNLTTR